MSHFNVADSAAPVQRGVNHEHIIIRIAVAATAAHPRSSVA